MTKIISIHSHKGGVGKTTVAHELAWLLGAVLADLEWDEGSATRQWGYRHEDRIIAPLVDALARNRTPPALRVPSAGTASPFSCPGTRRSEAWG